MACNENIIKNIANEITRNCLAQSCIVDVEFVSYLIELLLLNPKYGKLFIKTLNRTSLEFFVSECVSMLTKCDISLVTLKMQHLVFVSYDKPAVLVDKHLESIDTCLRPLVSEIMEADPELNDEEEFKKLFRKISIYTVMASGLGNPGAIATLREGVAALQSVFSIDELKAFVSMPRTDKLTQLYELLTIVSGVRLFNKDCMKGGDNIPDLAFKLVDAGKGVLSTLSNSLMTVMERVNTLTSAIEDTVVIQDETGNVRVDSLVEGLNVDDYNLVFELLTFNRQYELIIRKLLSDVSVMVENGSTYVERFKTALEDLHSAVKYKAAVPVTTVFPLFTKLWQVWRLMQCEMYLISTVSNLMTNLTSLQDQVKIPNKLIYKMLRDRRVVTDQDRMSERVSLDERLSLGSLKNYMTYNESFTTIKDRNIQYLGFCAVCLCIGALVPSNMRLGSIKVKNKRFGFCSVKMASTFSKDPDRYINEVLEHSRNHPQLINFLNISEEVFAVRYMTNIVTRPLPKLKVSDKDVQTEVHPLESYMKKNYTWNMWELKRRACQWATIVNCQTHSTQTKYSHLRSEIHCQTVEPRDKCSQTKKDVGVGTSTRKKYMWGMSRLYSDVQGYVELGEDMAESGVGKMEVKKFSLCQWPCIEASAEHPVRDSEIQNDGQSEDIL